MLTYLKVLCLFFIVSQATLFYDGQEYPSSSFLINKWQCDPSQYTDVVASSVALNVLVSEKCELVYPTNPPENYIAILQSTKLQFCLDRDSLYKEVLEHEGVVGAILLELEQNTAAKFYYHYPKSICNLKLLEIVYLPYSETIKDELNGASVILSFTLNDWQKEENVIHFRIFCSFIVIPYMIVFIYCGTQIFQWFFLMGLERRWGFRIILIIGIFACCTFRIIEYSLYFAYDLVFAPKGIPLICSHLLELTGFPLYSKVLIVWLELNIQTAASISQSLGSWIYLRRIAIINTVICVILIFCLIPEGFYPPIVNTILVYILTPFLLIFLIMFGVAFFAINSKLKWGAGDGKSLRKITILTGVAEVGFICLVVIISIDSNFGKESLTMFYVIQAFFHSALLFLGIAITYAFKNSRVSSGSTGSVSHELPPRTHGQKSDREKTSQDEMALQLEI